MLKIQIKNRWTGTIIFEYEKENNTVKDTVLECIRLARLDGKRADLTGANLTGANLTRADLTRADLTGADLTTIKADFFMVLFYAVKEIPALKQHLIDGKINGSAYEGECSCLKGTIATARGCSYTQLAGIKPNTSAPAECWFMNIKIGDTPENNNVSKITLEWINEFEMIVAGITVADRYYMRQ